MSEYKLVPVEPTKEQIEEFKSMWTKGFCDDQMARNCYNAFMDAAPAVQGERLGYDIPRMAARLGKGELCGISVLDQPEDGHTLPVYLGPQPAPDVVLCPGTGCTDQGCPAHYSTDHQPSPDVDVLVEALESIMGYIPLDVVHCRGDKCRELWCASRADLAFLRCLAAVTR